MGLLLLRQAGAATQPVQGRPPQKTMPSTGPVQEGRLQKTAASAAAQQVLVDVLLQARVPHPQPRFLQQASVFDAIRLVINSEPAIAKSTVKVGHPKHSILRSTCGMIRSCTKSKFTHVANPVTSRGLAHTRVTTTRRSRKLHFEGKLVVERAWPSLETCVHWVRQTGIRGIVRH